MKFCGRSEHVWDGYGGCIACRDKMSMDGRHMEEPVIDIPEVGSHIQAVAEELRLTLVSKNGDYAPSGEFSNFELSAAFAGIEPFNLILAQAAIKMTRINNLHLNDSYGNNESLRDSLLDLAGYAVIAAAFLDSVQADAAKDFNAH